MSDARIRPTCRTLRPPAGCGDKSARGFHHAQQITPTASDAPHVMRGPGAAPHWRSHISRASAPPRHLPFPRQAAMFGGRRQVGRRSDGSQPGEDAMWQHFWAHVQRHALAWGIAYLAALVVVYLVFIDGITLHWWLVSVALLLAPGDLLRVLRRQPRRQRLRPLARQAPEWSVRRLAATARAVPRAPHRRSRGSGNPLADATEEHGRGAKPVGTARHQDQMNVVRHKVTRHDR